MTEISEAPPPQFDNFPEGKFELYGFKLWSKRPKVNAQQNLSTYRLYETANPNEQGEHTEIMHFDIERYVPRQRNAAPLPSKYTYKMMINGFYPASEREELLRRRDSLEGFEPVPDDPSSEMRYNPDLNLFVNIDEDSEGKLRLGVIQKDKEPDFNQVTGTIVPEAAALFNRLSPTHQVSNTLVQRSVSIAAQCNAEPPYRIPASSTTEAL